MLFQHCFLVDLLQLAPALADRKGPTCFICYMQTSVFFFKTEVKRVQPTDRRMDQHSELCA